MLMVTHGAVGALIGEHTSNVFLAFLLGFISHFLLDIIPHGDRHDVQAYRTDLNFKKKTFLIIVFDAIVGICFLIFYFTLACIHQSSRLPTVIAGIIGSVIPDLLVAFHYLNKKYFFRLNFFHLKIHELIQFEIPQRLAIPLQLILIMLIILCYKF